MRIVHGWDVGRLSIGLLLTVVLAVVGCSSRSDEGAEDSFPEKLSSYGLFEGPGSAQRPAAGVIPYDLNTPLFSDYAVKHRFVRLPAGTKAKYDARESFEFPVGTIIAKTFAYPHDMRHPEAGERLIETRLLIHKDRGWIGLPYVWNDAQTEATLDLAGGTVDVAWIHTDGRQRTNNYIIPNTNQCKGCHKIGDHMQPIGPKARHLNRDFAYAEGSENQLAHWSRVSALSGAPDPKDAPRLAVWDDPHTGTLDQRTRAWLEVNCAHCHQPTGPAKNAGLNLLADETDPMRLGVFKPPVAAGRGSGGLNYDIVPGQPDTSILAFRIASVHPGVMMPELGKRLVHEEGLALVRQWISEMKNTPK
jgi:uncharacterized repeat protein (TIGR03806 family)